MARYVNLYKEKNVVISKAYDDDYGNFICEYEYMVAIERNDGTLVVYPVMCDNYLDDSTADEYIKEMEDEEIRVIMHSDCPARDRIIKDGITEWVCNQGCVDCSTFTEAICTVVSLLARNNMWKDEYAGSINVEKIKEEWNEK